MSETTGAVIVGAAESPYSRHPPEGTTTGSVLADAFVYAFVMAADQDEPLFL